MNKKTLLITLTAVLLLLFQAAALKAQSKSFTLKGVIDTAAHTKYTVSYRNNYAFVLDSITLDADSKFEYTAKISEPTYFSILIKQVNPLRTGYSAVYYFWVEPAKVINFAGKTGWLVNEGEVLTTRAKQYELKNSSTEISERNFNKSLDEARAAWEKKKGQSISKESKRQLQDSVMTDFIQKHPHSYYSLSLLRNNLQSFKSNFENGEKSLNTLSNEIRNTAMGKEVNRLISIHKIVGIGKVMPDFEQADTSSKMVKLSQYRGKYVLVDFWASWCFPCREENPYLLAAYKKYAAQGFEILSVSLDKNKALWQKGILEDQLPWAQVSDLQGFNSSLAKSFFITGIPDNFLLDPNGVIIAKKLRGTQLEQKMDQIFKDK